MNAQAIASPQVLASPQAGDEPAVVAGMTKALAQRPEVQQWIGTVRGQISKIWEPLVTEEARMVDPTGRFQADRDRRTVVKFMVDREGRVSNVRVVKSSDLSYLDAVALETFRRAARLPPPPPDLFTNGANEVEMPFALTLQWFPGSAVPRSQ